MDFFESLAQMETEEIDWYGLKSTVIKDRPRNLAALLDATVYRFPDKEGFRSETRKLTFRQFDEQAQCIAAGLQKRGIRQGDHVALLLSIQVEFPICFFALMKIGAVAVPLNTRFKGEELAFEINDSDSRMLIVDEDYWESIEYIKKELKRVSAIFYVGAGLPDGALSINELSNVPAHEMVAVEPEESDDAVIMYTSGTTGKPKGAVLHHHGLVLTAMLTNAIFQPAEDDRIACSVPLFHVTGLGMAMLAHIFRGVTGVYRKRFKTKEMLQTIASEKVTHYVGVANILWLMINHADFDQYDFSHFKRAMFGGAPVTEEMVKKILEKMRNLEISVGYGLTESTGVVTTTPYKEVLRKIKAVGKVLPPTDIMIADYQGKPVDTGSAGEILLRGSKIFKGYWNNREATRSALVDGWLHTGDIGKMDAEGFVYILDRKKDMINRGGEKIYSQEVENLIFSHPEVIEVAVVGVPDPVMGEAVKAVIVLRAGSHASEGDIQDFCRIHLADFKVPKHVEFKNQLPRNPAGKLIKSELRYVP